MELTHVEIERRDDGEVCLTIEVDPAEVDQTLREVYRELQRRVVVPGFRRGKVPPPILKQRMGREVFNRLVYDRIVPAAYRQAIEQEQLRPLTEARMEPMDWTEGTPLRFQAIVTVAPEPELGEYVGVPGERRRRDVGESDIDEVLEHLRQRFADWVERPDKEAAAGDQLLGQSVIRCVDDSTIEPRERRIGLMLGDESLAPALNEGLTGVKAGETRTVTFVYPDNGADEELRGKSVEMTVRIDTVRERRTPELTDEFAQQVARWSREQRKRVQRDRETAAARQKQPPGAGTGEDETADAGADMLPIDELEQVETMAELRQILRQRLEETRREESQKELEEELVAVVVGRSKVDAPTVLVDQEIDTRLRQMERELQRRGLNVEAYLRMTGMTEAEFREEFRPAAESSVRRDLVLEAIARRENLAPTEGEIAYRVAEVAGALDVEPDTFRQRGEEEGWMAALQRSVSQRKAIQFLLDHAVIEEVVIPADDAPTDAEPTPEPSEEPSAEAEPAPETSEDAPVETEPTPESPEDAEDTSANSDEEPAAAPAEAAADSAEKSTPASDEPVAQPESE